MQARLRIRSRFAALKSALAVAPVAFLALATPMHAFAEDLPDVCTALKAIVAAKSFSTLDAAHPLMPAGAPGQGTCRASAHAYDCRWQAHWGADGIVADPLQELGADIAACFPDVRHDVNTATRQHFVIHANDEGGTRAARPVALTATIDGPNALRLRVVR
ncbi:hypothetical protein AWB81_04111 [Caballeronia arationis]|jgi:hypothetical protein|uniref:Lipoprotein n=1 Tax=Caballeronia arationis TaxID=1777142 RepID=A0A7Z7N2K5_9BURK|nr:hypothetical protein [Caballeronia arationis]SAK82334.1 hypothetical protein AWB81_04111 [Caballeronia arationis]SOE62277.1 hypothetical protein SAMN05446927_2285 [Caballeronia arationis]